MRINWIRTFWDEDSPAEGAAPETAAAAAAEESPMKFDAAASAAVDQFIASRAPAPSEPEKAAAKDDIEGGEEEGSEEKATEEKKADPEPEKSKWLDDDTAYLAQQHGISREDALDFGSRKALNKAMALAIKLRAGHTAAPAGETAKTHVEKKPDPKEVDFVPEGLDLSVVDETSQQLIKGILKAQHEKVSSLQTQLNQFSDVENRRQADAFRDQFDSAIREVDPELFGKEHFAKTSEDLVKRREAVLNEVVPKWFAAIKAGQKPDLKDLAERCARYVYGKEMEERKTKATHKRIETKSKGRLATPGRPRPVAPHKHPSESTELAELWDSFQNGEPARSARR